MKNKTHISIDLETLGTKYNSYILAIGAVKFNIERGEILDKFYTKTLSIDPLFDIDVDTVKWWMEQNDEARKEVSSKKNEVPINNALDLLAEFVNGSSLVWGNGATFDVTILEHAYSIGRIGYKGIPWKYWNIRDMRTLVDVAADCGFNKKDVVREGDHHNAIDDAIYQAQVMSAAYEHITKRTSSFKPGCS